MTDGPRVDRLSGDEIQALKFAAHRQLARWAKKSGLSSRQRAQRGALTRAVGILGNRALGRGCELQVPPREDTADA